MKRMTLLFLLLTLAPAHALGQTSGRAEQNDKIVEEVMRREREWSAETVKKNIPALRQIVADDFAGIESSGRVIDKAVLISDIETGDDDVQADVPTELRVRVYGSVAVVTGRLTIRGVKKEGNYDLHLLFTDVWVRRDGRWQVVNYQATRSPRP